MGLFTHDAKQNEPDPVHDINNSMLEFQKRTYHLEHSSNDIEKEISYRDSEIERHYNFVKEEMERMRQENDAIKEQIKEADAILKQIVRNMRLLAQQRELKELNEMMEGIKPENLVTEADMRSMISDAKKQ